jgi:hypothetical protein
MRAKLTTLAEVAGSISITSGAAVWHVAVGLVVGGMFAIAGGFLFSVPKT